MRTSFSRHTARAVSAVTALVAIGGLSTAPAWADPAKPDLKIAVAVEPGTYVLGQWVPIKVTITNNSDTVATGVKADVVQLTGPSLNVSDWQDPRAVRPWQHDRTARDQGNSGHGTDQPLQGR